MSWVTAQFWKGVTEMKSRLLIASLIVTALISVVTVLVRAQDRFTLTSPDGIAFSEFRGYDAWQVIAPSQLDAGVKAIVGNPVMIKAFSEGIPANGQPVPDGAMMAKIEWSAKENPDLPGAARVPETLKNVGFMIKDAKRFRDSNGWGYAQFNYDGGSGTFKPLGSARGFAKAACHQCHTVVKNRDYVFSRYAQR
jgi:Cytochrome P460